MTSRTRGSRCAGPLVCDAGGDDTGNGRAGSYQTRSAGTETSSRSGQRSAVSLPPKTQPVSRHIVWLTHSGSGVGVCP